MTLADLLHAAEQASLEEEYRWLVSLNTHYSKRAIKARRRSAMEEAERQRDCDHVWTGTDTTNGEHYRICWKCELERTWLSDD